MGSEKMDSSSEESDGDEQFKAAISAAAAATFAGRPPPSKPAPTSAHDGDDGGSNPPQSQPLKHYQIKAQKTLDDILEKSLVVVKDPDPINIASGDGEVNEGGVRLFKKSPAGIVFDYRDEPKGPRKKPRILPGEEIDEKSKKFKIRVRSIVVDGKDILASAKIACQKSLAKFEAKEAAARDVAKREEERVAQLKKIRGERWLHQLLGKGSRSHKAVNTGSKPWPFISYACSSQIAR